MKLFMDKDFLLKTQTAKKLYHNHAANTAIIDYHCHVSPKDIAEDRQYENITQLWLAGDHYKWRLMRWCGVSEEYITGRATDKEKFEAFAAVLPQAIGNPVYTWAHLELQRYFECSLSLSPETAEEIWHFCNQKLQNGFSVRQIIRKSNVEVICTTDDPVDSLEWHKAIAEDESFEAKVLPTFRPDKAVNIQKDGFAAYIKQLGDASGIAIQSFDDVCRALLVRLEHFVQQGCRFADHGLDKVPWNTVTYDLNTTFSRGMAGETLEHHEVEAYQAALLLFLGKQYAKQDMVMQLHYGARRNVNPQGFEALGPDTGFDCISTPDCSGKLAALLGALQGQNALPKTVLYSLNPGDNAMLACLAGCFQQEGTRGWVQHGSAWWFNDTKTGMTQQLTTLADLGVLGCFVGMLTDSRSFTSYTRHEYFRRVLCNLIGNWVENGEYPASEENLGKLVQDIAYNNIARYMGLDKIK